MEVAASMKLPSSTPQEVPSAVVPATPSAVPSGSFDYQLTCPRFDLVLNKDSFEVDSQLPHKGVQIDKLKQQQIASSGSQK